MNLDPKCKKEMKSIVGPRLYHNIKVINLCLVLAGQVVMMLERPLRCQGCCCPCCLQEMEIFCPPGNKIATVKEV